MLHMRTVNTEKINRQASHHANVFMCKIGAASLSITFIVCLLIS